jgi:hypothetical protein
MSTFKVFELPRLAKILDVPLAKAKNWTNKRTGIVIEPSLQKATGTGSRGLYSINDLYLMGVAAEFSKAGFAAMAIGKLLNAVKPLLAEPIHRASIWTVWRTKPGGPFRIEAGHARPTDAVLWHTLEIGSLLKRFDQEIEKQRKAGN